MLGSLLSFIVMIFQVLLNTERRGPLRSFPPRRETKANPQDPMLILQHDLLRITTGYHTYEQLQDKDQGSVSFQF